MYADVHNTFLTYAPAHAWFSTTLVKNACILSAKNANELVHARLCNGAEPSLPWKLLRTYLESCTSIVQAVICRPLLLPLLLSRPNLSPDAVRSRNPSTSTLAHDAVAAAVWHKHHSIIRVGAGLIQFVHGSHSHMATGVTSSRSLFSPFFCASFICSHWSLSDPTRGYCDFEFSESDDLCHFTETKTDRPGSRGST